jgi:hypothetical protein
VSARDTHQAQKREVSNQFSRPPTLSQAEKWPPHNHPANTYPPLLLSPLSITSPDPLSLSLHLSSRCVTLTSSSQPPCFLRMAITQPSSLPITPSPRQTLIHVRCLAIPAGIQLNSRWQDAEVSTSPGCSFDSGLL